VRNVFTNFTSKSVDSGSNGFLEIDIDGSDNCKIGFSNEMCQRKNGNPAN